jgi:hypothetical protein
LLTGDEAEGNDIPSAVPVENLTPETREAAGGAPEVMEEAAGEAVAVTGGEEAIAEPGPALEVVVLSLEIQDAEPIRFAPMTEAATSSRGGVELQADDLVDPATVAWHLEAVRQAEQWMKVSSHTLRVVNPLALSTHLTYIVCAGRRGEVLREVQHASRLRRCGASG